MWKRYKIVLIDAVGHHLAYFINKIVSKYLAKHNLNFLSITFLKGTWRKEQEKDFKTTSYSNL